MKQYPTVSVFLGISLDGYIAGEGNDLAWLEPYSTDPPEETGYTELMHKSDALIMGRNTFEVVSQFDAWPHAGKRVIVMTRRPITHHRPVEAFDGPLLDLLERLHQQHVHHVYVDGGNLIRQALTADIVDEMTLSWVPLILGGGIPLFAPGLIQSTWKPDHIKQFPSGLVQTRYSRNRTTAS